MTEDDLVHETLKLPDHDRPAFLDWACTDPASRARVEALLTEDTTVLAPTNPPESEPPQTTRLAVSPDTTMTPGVHSPATDEAEVILADKYKLLKKIGEGGMGSVWVAAQAEPVKRLVAVKLIQSQFGNSAAILARFEAERQAIAVMVNPHIAKLLDAGTTPTGTPYFVMEYVQGGTLTEYCNRQRLGIQERLQLFLSICSAVQHAHQKGIIHRDLKPSNILVESPDGKPVPKVIDFGLAKATSGETLTDQPLLTGIGTVMGTPFYMAPELASFNTIDVDTLYISNGGQSSVGPLIGIKAGASGDITTKEGEKPSEFVTWNVTAGGSGWSSPLAHNGYLYVPGKGTLACYDTKTGKQQYNERVPKMTRLTACLIGTGGPGASA
jgi:serine/threonine protein kinase